LTHAEVFEVSYERTEFLTVVAERARGQVTCFAVEQEALDVEDKL